MKITAGLSLLAGVLTVSQAQVITRHPRPVALSNVETVETAYLDLRTFRSVRRGTAAVDRTSNSYKVSKVRGKLSGVQVRVSGLGGWSRMKGSMVTSSLALDKSGTYNRIKNTYGIEAGIRGFYAFLSGGLTTNAERESVKETMNELTSQDSTNAVIDVDLLASGYAPNVEVTASAYVTALQIEDETGNKYTILSDGNPEDDIFPGDDDQNGAQLPEEDDTSTITFA